MLVNSKKKCEYHERIRIFDFNAPMKNDYYKRDGIHANIEGKYALCYNILEIAEEMRNQPFLGHLCTKQ